MLMWPVLEAPVLLAATAYCTVVEPAPVVDEVMVSQDASLTAFQPKLFTAV